MCVSGTFRPWELGDRPGENSPTLGRLPGSYKGLATFAPALSSNFSTVVEIFGGDPTFLFPERRGRGTVLDSHSTPDNHALTPSGPGSLLFEFLRSSRSATEVSNSHGQGRTHISAEPPAPEADPRVPRPDGDQEGPAGPRAPAREGAQAPRCDRFAVRTSCRRHESLPMPSNACHRRGVIRRRREFQRVFDAGRRAHGRHLTIIAAPFTRSRQPPRHRRQQEAGGAVVRNRAKRLIREMFRTQISPESRLRPRHHSQDISAPSSCC